MEIKRSKGVTVLGWLFIIGGCFGLLAGLRPHTNTQNISSLPHFIDKLADVASLICGIFLLKLKPWARKLAMGLCCVSIILVISLLIPLVFSPAVKSNFEQSFNRSIEKKEQLIREQYKPEYQQKALEKFKKYEPFQIKFTYIIMFSVAAVGIGWNLYVLYFFTRPKVKEQFK